MFDQNCHLIFATNFSDACHAAIPAVARWVDQLHCRLTILHVYDPEKLLYRDAERLLNSFFAEANNYPACDRVLISGDAAEGIAAYCRKQSNALLLLPPTDQAGLPRPWHKSLRAQMLKRLDIPVWTLGRTMVGSPMPLAAGHLAVLMRTPEEGTAHLRQAARYAARTGATLHLLHVLPEIDERTLTHTIDSGAPLGLETATHWMNEMAECLEPVERLQVHIERGSLRKQLPELMHRTGADLLIANRESFVAPGWLGPSISRAFRSLRTGILAIPHTPASSSNPDLQRAVSAVIS
ncbi:MAG: universal stress protein [Acidobacteriaceae bacterium]|nr:universal stress protein [Acidobacteriaceae bacterium]